MNCEDFLDSVKNFNFCHFWRIFEKKTFCNFRIFSLFIYFFNFEFTKKFQKKTRKNERKFKKLRKSVEKKLIHRLLQTRSTEQAKTREFRKSCEDSEISLFFCAFSSNTVEFSNEIQKKNFSLFLQIFSSFPSDSPLK